MGCERGVQWREKQTVGDGHLVQAALIPELAVAKSLHLQCARHDYVDMSKNEHMES